MHTLANPSARMALAGYLHDLGKLAERAGISVDKESLATHQQHQLADALPQLSQQEKQQAHLLAQELFRWWQVDTKKNKKAKTLLQRFKQEAI